MVTIVADNIIVLADYHCQNTLVHREACREAEAVLLADKLSNLFFQLYVEIERSVEEPASGATRAILVEGALGSIDNALVARQTSISVRAKHQHFVSAHFNLCSLLALNGTEIGIYICLHVLLGLTVELVFFL